MIKNQKSKIKNQRDGVVAVKLSDVSKKYFIHHEKPTLAERILNGKNEEFYALKNVSLSVNRGERVGVIGSNGSGKTTLLKIVSGITSPTRGKVETCGRVVSLIDLEAGFHPDLTGIQNIFLNGTLLGMNRKEIELKFADIVKFADIGKFIDAPLFTYSEGMKLRLGFSVAVNSSPDLLLVDESLSVGDENFTQKAQQKINWLVDSGVTLLLASHVLPLISSICDKVFWLKKGKLLKFGDTDKIISQYVNEERRRR